MGSLLREVLKSICTENGWTYAVFWKAKHRNPMILLWEEGHYEHGLYAGQSGSSPFGDQPLFLRELEALLCHPGSSQSKFHGNDLLDVLFSKMKDQVHVVGKGIVGHVSLMGTYRWVFQETCMDEGYTSGSVFCETSLENSSDWYNQFSAGIQTVAIISVPPHGVLQCGSVERIGESMGFVNLVRNMFMQFGVSNASPLEVTPVVLNLNIPKIPDAYGVVDSTDISHVKVERSEPSVNEIHGEPVFSHPARFLSNEPRACNSLLANVGGVICADASTVPSISSLVVPSTGAFGDLFQQKALLSVNPNPLARGQLETVLTGGTSEAISNPSMQLNQYISQVSGKSCGNVNIFQQQNLPSVVSHGTLDTISSFDCTVLSQCEIDEGKRPLPPDVSAGLISGSIDLVNSRTGIGEAVNSDPSVLWKSVLAQSSRFPQSSDHQHTDLASMILTSASIDLKELCGVQINSNVSGASRTGNNGSTIDRQTLSARAAMPVSIENDLFQAMGLPLSGTGMDKHYSFNDRFPDYVPDFVQSGLTNDLLRRGNLQPAKTEHEESSLVTLSGSGNSSENFGCFDEVKLNPSTATLQLPSLNHMLGRLHSDIKTNESQSGCSSVVSQLKNIENTCTRTDFSSCTSELNIASMTKVFSDGHIDNSCFSENRSGNLLDAIVSGFHSYSDGSSNGHISRKAIMSGIGSYHTDTTPFELLTTSEKKQEVAYMSQSHVKLERVIPNRHSLSDCSLSRTAEGSQTDRTSKSQASMKMEDSNLQHDNNLSVHSGRAEESTKSKQKRPKPGESTRPRPKDRQQIQDRVKELREIVPNGAKCSIDALLERTIKHMLFLQSVTKYADKLKQTGESKLISKDGGLLLKDNFEGGVTWAFEVGSKSMVCPIIVEDLNVPRQMLVEMLCEERGFFLEIADMIRGMGLTILKGVMETRNNKIWAHFAVEANRDITRMEVFMSLVHLLEQISNSKSPKNMASGLPAFDAHHRSTIPAAGSVERLQ